MIAESPSRPIELPGASSRVRDPGPRGRARQLAAEVVGTFFLVTAAAGGRTWWPSCTPPKSAVARVVAPALVVMAMIYAFGKVSGAHFNPAVTVAFAVRTVFPWRRVPAYLAAEVAGAVAAAALLHLLLSPVRARGHDLPPRTHRPEPGPRGAPHDTARRRHPQRGYPASPARPRRGAADGGDHRGRGHSSGFGGVGSLDEPCEIARAGPRWWCQPRPVDLCRGSTRRRLIAVVLTVVCHG